MVLTLLLHALATQAGIEPAVCRLGGGCFIRLSYQVKKLGVNPAHVS